MECGHDASFTKRKVENNEIELIGANDIYTAVCRECFFNYE